MKRHLQCPLFLPGNSKIVGICGALGPETTARLYMSINRKFSEYSGFYPNIIIDNVAFPLYLEKNIIINFGRYAWDEPLNPEGATIFVEDIRFIRNY